jgi:pimeloyl-ACP methyl ester carboxylesterase
LRPRRASSLSSLALLCGIAACEDRFTPPQCSLAEDWTVPTADGAEVFLHHHPGAGPPVLVVHGISSNHWVWDLAPGRSLATTLVDHGFDAWLLDLRGHGGARNQPDDSDGDWSIDDYALHDLPAALGFIRQKTGASRVGYVGHSLGGMVGAIYAVHEDDPAFFAFAAVGSPVDFRDPDPIFELMQGTVAIGGSLLPTVRTPPLAAMLNAVPGKLPLKVESLLYNPANIAPDAARLMMDHIVSPLWPGEMRQFGRIIHDGRLESADGSVDWFGLLDRLDTPVLAIGGRADRVAPPDRVKALVDRAGSTDKRFVLAGRENGFAEDYGHLDLCLGDRASSEIYPLVIEWLEAHRPD